MKKAVLANQKKIMLPEGYLERCNYQPGDYFCKSVHTNKDYEGELIIYPCNSPGSEQKYGGHPLNGVPVSLIEDKWLPIYPDTVNYLHWKFVHDYKMIIKHGIFLIITPEYPLCDICFKPIIEIRTTDSKICSACESRRTW